MHPIGCTLPLGRVVTPTTKSTKTKRETKDKHSNRMSSRTQRTPLCCEQNRRDSVRNETTCGAAAKAKATRMTDNAPVEGRQREETTGKPTHSFAAHTRVLTRKHTLECHPERWRTDTARSLDSSQNKREHPSSHIRVHIHKEHHARTHTYVPYSQLTHTHLECDLELWRTDTARSPGS